MSIRSGGRLIDHLTFFSKILNMKFFITILCLAAVCSAQSIEELLVLSGVVADTANTVKNGLKAVTTTVDNVVDDATDGPWYSSVTKWYDSLGQP